MWVPSSREVAPPAVLRDAVRHHVEARTFGHSASSSREIAEMVGEACGREVEVPGLRDAGFVQVQAHGCENMGGVHVIYANSWLKASCFVISMCTAGFETGRPVEDSGVRGRAWQIDGHSLVAVPEGDVVKVWVADLKPSQLEAIAVDTELKRSQVKTAVFTVKDAAISGPLGATLRATPGVEEVRLEDARGEAVIRYDRRRISPDELAAMLVINGFPAGPREWGGR
jgi:hypothetical protein